LFASRLEHVAQIEEGEGFTRSDKVRMTSVCQFRRADDEIE
jgi:hypothetical protein